MGPIGHSVAALSAVAGIPAALLALALRPKLRPGWRERLGLVCASGATPGSVWVHGASVGEILAARPLMSLLRERGCGVYASTVTATGREVMGRACPDLPCGLAPLDHPWCVAAALSRVRPAALVLVELEVWPSWIVGAAERGLPVILVSGRLSPRSDRWMRRLRPLFGPALARLAAVGARTAGDAERFAALGIPRERVRVTGDLKLAPPDRSAELADDLAAALGALPLFVAASTHEGEERAALAALDAATAAGHPAALLLAPRHPERFEAVAAALAAEGRPFRRRTKLGGEPLGPGDVLLLDSVGELPATFARAIAAFVGGSLVPRGGHNVLEPVLAGCPVLVGPHTANVDHVVELLAPSGALRRVADGAGLSRALVEVLRDPGEARDRADRGRALARDQRDTALRTLELVEETMAAGRKGAA